MKPANPIAAAFPFAAALLIASCEHPATLPVLGEIPQFTLTDQSGKTFDSHALDGHPWVADFIFTTCPGPCPMMSHKMSGVQQATVATPEVRLISFTVDPVHDTPAVLADYAHRFQADAARWSFLTGDIARLNDLALNAFKLSKVDGSLEHSTRFVLIDGKRRIRGYYLSNEDDFPKLLLRDLRQLRSES